MSTSPTSAEHLPTLAANHRRFVLIVLLLVLLLFSGLIVALAAVRLHLVARQTRIEEVAREFNFRVHWRESVELQKFCLRFAKRSPPDFIADFFRDLGGLTVGELKADLPTAFFQDLSAFRRLQVIQWKDTRHSAQVATFARQQEQISVFELFSRELRDRDIQHTPLFAHLTHLSIDGLESPDLNGRFLTAAVGHALPLKQLSLVNVHLEEEGCEAIGRLASLKYLALHGCRLTSERAKSLSSLTALRTLILTDNHVDDEFGHTLEKLTSLEVLAIPNTPLSAEGLCHLEHCRHLTNLETRGKRGNAKLLDRLKKCASLKDVDIVWTGDFTQEELAGFRDMPELTYLYFDDFGDSNARNLIQCDHITGLDIQGDRLTLDGVRSLMSLRNLHYLKLPDRAWEPELVDVLHECPNLDSVKLGPSTWESSEFEELRLKLKETSP